MGCGGRCGTARLALRAAVSGSSWDVPSTTAQPMLQRTQMAALQRRVWECDHACAVCWNGPCRATQRDPITCGLGCWVGSEASIRRAGRGGSTGPGTMRSREHSRSAQNHVGGTFWGGLPRCAAHAAGSTGARALGVTEQRGQGRAGQEQHSGWGVAGNRRRSGGGCSNSNHSSCCCGTTREGCVD